MTVASQSHAVLVAHTISLQDQHTRLVVFEVAVDVELWAQVSAELGNVLTCSSNDITAHRTACGNAKVGTL